MNKKRPGPGRRSDATRAVAVAAIALAGLAAAGCSHRSAAPRASVESCVQFGIDAIRHHVTATSLPPACRGLTQAQISFAVGSGVHSAAAGARGKARQRQRMAKVGHFLEHLVPAAPQQPSAPQAPAPAARQPSRTALGLIALCTWLITVGLGLRMMARWFARGRHRRAPPRQPRRPPALNLAHFGFATTGLLAWIAYLATGVIGVAWAACALLLPAAGLGMTLVFLRPSTNPVDGAATAQAARGGTLGATARGGTLGPAARGDPTRVRRRPVLEVSAHIAFATATILFAFLTAIGAG